MPVQEREPLEHPAREAEENLRIIRSLMERSTRYSTFSGPSGVLAGSFAIIGCLIHRFYVMRQEQEIRPILTLATWTAVIVAAVGADFLLTKRNAPLVGKRIRSHLGKQMVLAAMPALGTGVLITLYLYSIHKLPDVFPFWM